MVADPHLNRRFLRECRSRGLSEADVDLNLCLLNLRKTGDLQGIQSMRMTVRGQADYRFASEIAIRFLERRDQVSLDQILSDPARAAEFDHVADEIAPGFLPFQYRWAALNLRKRKSLQPELLSKVIVAEQVRRCRVEGLNPAEIPRRAGLYLLIQPRGVLYVGECGNLRKRVGQHLDHSHNKGLARWLWQHGFQNLHVEFHVLPPGVSARMRRALEAELIRSRKPTFNIAGTVR